MDLNRLNGALERYFALLTPVMIIIGFIFSEQLAPLNRYVQYLFATLSFTGALGISFRTFLDSVKKPRQMIVFLLTTHIITPVLIYFSSRLLYPNSIETVTGLMLLFTIPTAVLGTIMVGMYGGNTALSVACLVIDTMLSPVLTPLTIRIFTGSSVDFDMTSMIGSLLVMVVIPTLLAMTLRQFSKQGTPERVAYFMKPISKIFLLCVIAFNIADVAPELIEKASWRMLLMFIEIMGLTLMCYLTGYLMAKIFHFHHKDTVSLTYSTAMKNISAALVLATSFFSAEAALPIILAILTQNTLASIVGTIILRNEKKHTQSGVLPSAAR